MDAAPPKPIEQRPRLMHSDRVQPGPGPAMNRLYHYPLSPFSRKVRLALAEKRIEVELVEERYWEQDPDFLRRNPASRLLMAGSIPRTRSVTS